MQKPLIKRVASIEGYIFGGALVAILAVGGYFAWDAVNYNKVPDGAWTPDANKKKAADTQRTH